MSALPQTAEFLWDDVVSLQQQGFSVEPSKDIVEPGHKCTITITWTPQTGYKVREIIILLFFTFIELGKQMFRNGTVRN